MWLMLFGIPIVTLVTTIMIFGVEGISDFSESCLPMGFIYTIVYWLGFRYVTIHYHKRYPGYTFNFKRLFYVLSRMAIMYILIDIVMGQVVKKFFAVHAEFHDEHDIEAQVITITMIALGFFLYEGIYYFNQSRIIEIEKNKLHKITAEQKLSTLKDQVNPHFLFNSLNTLVTMIPEEPNVAITFVQHLSQSYRNILEVRDEKLITLKQELKALESYIYLLKTRFHGKIHIFNTVNTQHLDHFIIPISLQILIENAVKHNITSSSKPLKIELFSENNFIVVRNNLQKKNQKYNSTKMGLSNIQSRYNLLTEQEIKVIESDDYFIVKLPIITNNRHEDINN